MAIRPSPIIIPGPSSMGGRTRSTQANLNLPGLVKLYDMTIGQNKREAADQQAGLALAKFLGLGGEVVAPTVTETLGGGSVNAPVSPSVDASALAGSSFGRDTLKAIASNIASKTGRAGGSIHTEVLEGPDKKPHTYVIDALGGKIDLGVAGSKPSTEHMAKIEELVAPIFAKMTDEEKLITFGKLKAAGNPLGALFSEDFLSTLVPERLKKPRGGKPGTDKQKGLPTALQGVTGAEGKDRYTDETGTYDWDYKGKAWVKK